MYRCFFGLYDRGGTMSNNFVAEGGADEDVCRPGNISVNCGELTPRNKSVAHEEIISTDAEMIIIVRVRVVISQLSLFSRA